MATFPSLPPAVFDALPEDLKNITRVMDLPLRRDLFLLPFMPVLGTCAQNVIFRYGGMAQLLNSYLAVVAPASAGKSRIMPARAVAEALNHKLLMDSRAERQQWKSQRDSDDEPNEFDEKPPLRRIFIAGDTSGAGIKTSLGDSPYCCMFETEAKSLGTAMGSEYGNFRDVLLKCFHNEPVSVDRKYEVPLLVMRPALSMVLAGTPGSFESILRDTEDGLFSRFMFYYFETPLVFQNMFDDESETAVSIALDEIAVTLEGLYRVLSARRELLSVHIHKSAQTSVVAVSERAMQALVEMGGDLNLASNIKRAAVIAVRWGTLLSLWNAYRSGVPLDWKASHEVEPQFVEVGLRMAYCCLDHALTLADLLSDGIVAARDKLTAFRVALPDGEFSTADAEAAARVCKIPRRTMFYYLKSLEGMGVVESRGYGAYAKMAAPEPGKTHAFGFSEFAANIIG